MLDISELIFYHFVNFKNEHFFFFFHIETVGFLTLNKLRFQCFSLYQNQFKNLDYISSGKSYLTFRRPNGQT